jgi:hypothetical protein
MIWRAHRLIEHAGCVIELVEALLIYVISIVRTILSIIVNIIGKWQTIKY